MLPTGLRKLAGASIFVTSATAITFICSIVALGFNTRALGTDLFGKLALIQAFVSLISGFTNFDNWQPIVRLGIRSPDRLGLVIGAGMFLDICASVTAALIAGSCMLFFSVTLGFGEIALVALLPYCLSLLAGVGGTPKGYFRLQGRFDRLAQNQIGTGLLQLASSVALWYLDAPFEAYLVTFGIVAAVPGLSLLIRMLTDLHARHIALVAPWGSASRRRYLRTFLRMAGGNSILSTLATSRHQISLFIISSVAGSAATGLFAAASRCANALTKFFVPISQIIFPEILRLQADRSAAEVRRAMWRITLFSGVSALGVIMIGAMTSRLVVTVAAGPEFAGAADIFLFLLAAEVTLWAGFHFTPYLLATLGQTPLLRVNLAISAVTALLALVLVRFQGATGGGAAIFAGALMTYIALFILARRGLRKPPASAGVEGA